MIERKQNKGYDNMLSIEGDTRTAVVYVPTTRGEFLRIRLDASPYQAGGNHPMHVIECDGAEAKAHQQFLRELILSARLSERTLSQNTQIWVEFDQAVSAEDDLWQLGVVLADRLARGVIAPPAIECPLFALGGAEDWALGYVRLSGNGEVVSRLKMISAIEENTSWQAVIAQAPANSLVSLELAGNERWSVIAHLGALLGHPEPKQTYRSAKVWFPLVGGETELAWVAVSVQPMQARNAGQGAGQRDGQDGQETIVVREQNLARRERVSAILSGARTLEKDHGAGWLTSIAFSHHAFTDNSYELALVMADRIARGREFLPVKRLVASGCSAHWRKGKVEAVGGIEEKIKLCEKLLDKGDRLLLPQDGVETEWLVPLQDKGVTVGLLSQLNKL